MENNRMKKTKLFISMMKEKIWLEQMALNGYKLIKMTMGMRYTFEKIEPTRLIYEIDRFNLPKNPTLREIKSKHDSIAMAEEMGWKIVLHDEDLNYYLCKEYAKGDINELYNDQESRQIHAEKYRKRYTSVGKEMLNLVIFLNTMLIIIGIIEMFDINKVGSAFTWLVVGCTMFSVIMAVLYNKVGELYYNEFLITEEEWIKKNDYLNNDSKILRKYIFRSKTLQKFLEKEGENGWYPQKLSLTRYTFIKSESGRYQYIMDSKYLTNKRLKAIGASKISDPKDLGGIGNDWQVQSVEDAEKLGWKFVCAVQNQSILYRAPKANNVEQLNPNGKMSFVGILSFKTGMIFVVSGGFGFAIGLIWKMLSH